MGATRLMRHSEELLGRLLAMQREVGMRKTAVGEKSVLPANVVVSNFGSRHSASQVFRGRYLERPGASSATKPFSSNAVEVRSAGCK